MLGPTCGRGLVLLWRECSVMYFQFCGWRFHIMERMGHKRVSYTSPDGGMRAKSAVSDCFLFPVAMFAVLNVFCVVLFLFEKFWGVSPITNIYVIYIAVIVTHMQRSDKPLFVHTCITWSLFNSSAALVSHPLLRLILIDHVYTSSLLQIVYCWRWFASPCLWNQLIVSFHQPHPNHSSCNLSHFCASQIISLSQIA